MPSRRPLPPFLTYAWHEVFRQDVVIENGQLSGYRVRLALSIKYDSGD